MLGLLLFCLLAPIVWGFVMVVFGTGIAISQAQPRPKLSYYSDDDDDWDSVTANDPEAW